MNGGGDTIQYRLTFLQAFANPCGWLIYRCYALLLLAAQIVWPVFFMNAFDETAFAAACVIDAAMLGHSMYGLIAGAHRIPGTKRIEFQKDGMHGEFGRPGSASREQAFAYRYLHVRPGLFGISIVSSPVHQGQFVMVPDTAMSTNTLQEKIRQGRSQHLRTMPAPSSAWQKPQASGQP